METPVIWDAIALIMSSLYLSYFHPSTCYLKPGLYVSYPYNMKAVKGMCNTVSLSYHMSFHEALQYMHHL